MSLHWLEAALQAGLENIDNGELVRLAALHNLVEDTHRQSRTAKRISPSLLAEECMLAQVKRYRKHSPQPGWSWGAVKQGVPSASSNLHFLRGFFGEGMMVAALNKVARTWQAPFYGETPGQALHSETEEGLGLFPFDVLGCSPWAVFEATTTSHVMKEVEPGRYEATQVNYLAYPDVIMTTDMGVELVQMKCPSVFAFDRYAKDGGASLRKRYEPQAITEMYVGRLLGLPIARNHILAFTWEGWRPGMEHQGQEIRTIVETVEWSDDMAVYIETLSEQVQAADEAADQGEWPVPYPEGTNWPCSYCNYARVAMYEGQTTCEENHKWEAQSSGQSSARTGQLVQIAQKGAPLPPPLPSMMSSPPPLPSPNGPPPLPSPSGSLPPPLPPG
jgi:hypothetical protein